MGTLHTILSRKALVLLACGACVTTLVQAQDRTLSVSPAVQPSEQRIALVIGNGGYKNSPLANPVNDARDMAVSLSSLGFKVSLKENADQRTMKQAVRDFGNQLKAGGVGLFYYAGHGMQVKGRNYLIPVNEDVQSEDEVEDQSLDVNLVLEKMESAQNRINVIILDACRNNPFQRRFRSAGQGLAQLDAAKGSLIAYSTAPGSIASDGTGRNGIYTKHLLAALKQSDSAIESVFKRVRVAVLQETAGKQIPWESSSLVGDFHFHANAAAAAPAPAASLPAADTPLAVEIAYWQSIQASNDRADFEAYRKRFPEGQFSEVAENRLKTLAERQLTGAAPAVSGAAQPKATVIFFRPRGFAGWGVTFAVTHKNRELGKLALGEYASYQTNAGEATFNFETSGGGASRTYELAAGKTHYVRLQWTLTEGFSMSMVPESEAGDQVKTLADKTPGK